PVALPPGRARLSTKPAPSGSVTPTKTIGMLRLRRFTAATLSVPLAKMMSGASVVSSEVASGAKQSSWTARLLHRRTVDSARRRATGYGAALRRRAGVLADLFG